LEIIWCKMKKLTNLYLLKELISQVKEQVRLETNNAQLLYPKIKHPDYLKASSWVGNKYLKKQSYEELRKGELYFFVFIKTGKEICTKTVCNYVKYVNDDISPSYYKSNSLNYLCEYIGKKSWENFKILVKASNFSNHSLKSLYNTGDDTAIWLGFYFSIKDFKIKKVILSLKTTKDDNGNIKENECEVREWGFHSFEDRIGIRKREYSGTGILKNQYLYITLNRDFDDEPDLYKKMKISAKVGEYSIFDESIIIRASCQASSESDPESGLLDLEMVFIPINRKQLTKFDKNRWSLKDSKILDSDLVNKIYFHLSTHINNFRVRNEVVKKNQWLKYSSVTFSKLQKLVGVYRLWNFGIAEGRIIQSRFTIRNNGTAILEPPIVESYLNAIKDEINAESLKGNKNIMLNKAFLKLKTLSKQPCVILPSGYKKVTKILAVTFTAQMKPVNNAIFDMVELINKKFAIGAFSSVGYDDKHFPFCEYYIMEYAGSRPDSVIPQFKDVAQLNKEEQLKLEKLKKFILEKMWYIKELEF